MQAYFQSGSEIPISLAMRPLLHISMRKSTPHEFDAHINVPGATQTVRRLSEFIRLISKCAIYGPGRRSHVARGAFLLQRRSPVDEPKLTVKDRDGVKPKAQLGIEAVGTRSL